MNPCLWRRIGVVAVTVLNITALIESEFSLVIGIQPDVTLSLCAWSPPITKWWGKYAGLASCVVKWMRRFQSGDFSDSSRSKQNYNIRRRMTRHLVKILTIMKRKRWSPNLPVYLWSHRSFLSSYNSISLIRAIYNGFHWKVSHSCTLICALKIFRREIYIFSIPEIHVNSFLKFLLS